jgi:glycosyltransferase involved in cell wall biosynthesis
MFQALSDRRGACAIMQIRPVVIAVPAKDEAAHLPACLHALTHQQGERRHTILILVNNSGDDSLDVVHRFAATSSIRILGEDVVLTGAAATAGGARRAAMQRAADLAGANGIILTTDADGRVAPDWLAANLNALAVGADAVAGRAVIDPEDEKLIPDALLAADARECTYAALLDELAARIDPDPADPWPRHDEHSGASIAVTVEAFRRVGGIPAMPMGEDRAFFRQLQRIDARIRHAPEVQVVVSGRIEGRAAGGMADTIRRRLVCPDVFLDDRLEPARDALVRSRLRRQARLLWADPARTQAEADDLAHALRLPRLSVRTSLSSQLFGAAWNDLETESPRLRRRRVAAAAVMHETWIARNALAATTEDADTALEIPA